jgi:hypothetical protein
MPMVDDAPVSLTNTVTETAFQPGALNNPGFLLPMMIKGGTGLEINAWGSISTSGTTPTFIWKLVLGQTNPIVIATGINIAATAAFTLTNQVGVAWPWRLRYFGRFTQAGVAGSLVGSGSIEIATSLTAFTPRNIPETIAARTVTVNCNVAMGVILAGTWGTAAATNIAICDGLIAVAHG